MKIAIALAVILLGLAVYVVATVADLQTVPGWAEVTILFLLVVLVVRLALEHWHNRDK